MNSFNENNDNLIIGNSRLSNILIKNKDITNFNLISLRDIWSEKVTIKSNYKNIFYVSQLTRRYRNDYELLRKNSDITDFVLKSSTTASQIIFISSIDVFGTEVQTFSNDLKLNPFDYYSESKVKTEMKIRQNFAKNVILRFPGLYGNDLEENSVISRMIKSLINEKKITLTSPLITRSLLSYEHAASYLFECHKKLKGIEKGNFYGIMGSKKSLTLDEIADLLLEMKCFFGPNLSKIIDRKFDTSSGRPSEQYIKQISSDFIKYDHDDIKSGINLFIGKLIADGILKEKF